MAYLALSVEDVIINKWELSEGTLSIGRAAENDIQIKDSAVSSQHARVITGPNPFIEGQLITYIEDLKSTNGTELNGREIARQQLDHEDIIRIGFSQFQYIDKEATTLDETAIIIG
ncbi:FHA domain-containing protein [Colwellia sp. E2M01]|uniref:FHA domain-containing protein n=1 Tax=Colwellia sp. E2M01 TaxID=2841561 RepID=UPI001C08BB11|nr:FHA domain-containing protein [Colwellia sp. E2M01]MBU2871350.1 FHA domain-containing protein [Colwellia sp. E2M01]